MGQKLFISNREAAAAESSSKTKLENESILLLETIKETETELTTLYIQLADEGEIEETEADIQQRITSVKAASANIKEAYRRSRNISDELSARWNDFKNSRKRKIIPPAPTNAVIDLQESKTKHFTQGLSIYKLLWLCYIGSFAGVLIELLWCLLTNGYLESRSGLVYGPFNLLYGAGAAALTLALYKYRNHGKWQSFIGGFAVGSIVEYACSWGQEILFGSHSWDYSHMPFNINGRICLLYSVFWGILGVLWIKSLYPRMAKIILKIPNRAGKIITLMILVFFVINAAVSLIAVLRWSDRVVGIEAGNQFWEFIDLRFPDERMERVFANMEF